jgi:hypothetical protein
MKLKAKWKSIAQIWKIISLAMLSRMERREIMMEEITKAMDNGTCDKEVVVDRRK